MTTHLETQPAAHGLAAVLIPRGLTSAEERDIRARLGLACRHGRNVRATYGRCPACAASHNRSTTREISA